MLQNTGGGATSRGRRARRKQTNTIAKVQTVGRFLAGGFLFLEYLTG